VVYRISNDWARRYNNGCDLLLITIFCINFVLQIHRSLTWRVFIARKAVYVRNIIILYIIRWHWPRPPLVLFFYYIYGLLRGWWQLECAKQLYRITYYCCKTRHPTNCMYSNILYSDDDDDNVAELVQIVLILFEPLFSFYILFIIIIHLCSFHLLVTP